MYYSLLTTSYPYNQVEFFYGRLLLLLFLLSSQGLSLQAQEITFIKHSVNKPISNPNVVFAFDLDNDGDQDVLTADDGKFAWYENNGVQFFTEKIIDDTYKKIDHIEALDLDKDGDLDILTGSNLGRITWYENNGSLKFTEKQIGNISGGSFPSLQALDMDGDGDLDILAAFWENDTVCWYENNGNMNFTKKIIRSNKGDVNTAYATDIDGDGDQDVLVGDFNNGAFWYNNDGNQNFTEVVINTSFDRVSYIYAVDIDRDGDQDVFAASTSRNKIAWYENDGTLIFTEQLITQSLGALTVQLTDMNQDGELDILAAGNANGRNKSVFYKNNGAQNFTEQQLKNLNTSSPIYAVDLDGDNDQDIISTADFSISWNENDGVQNFARRVIASGNFGMHSFQVTDINQDNDLDVVSVARDVFKISWHENSGAQAFAEKVIESEGIISGRGNIGISDIGLDGDQDIILDGNWFENDGTQNFSLRGINQTIFFDFTNTSDMDGDGDQDILVSSTKDSVIGVWLENDSTHNFPVRHIFTRTNASTFYFLYTSDVDQDGDQDVFATNRDETIWYENDGSFNFTEKVIDSQGASSILTSDMDGDNDIDIIIASESRISWYENNSNQNFNEHRISANAFGASSVAVIDIDGDGDQDVAAISGNDIAWYENDGNQNFSQRVISTDIDRGTSILVIDMDKDGDQDIVACDYDEVFWYEQTIDIDESPLVINPIADITFTGCISPLTLDLSTVFDDPDNDNQLIVFSIINEAELSRLSPSLEGGLLYLNPSPGPNESFDIIIEGLSNGLSTYDTVSITLQDILIKPQPTILGNSVLCENEIGLYSVEPQDGHFYTWQIIPDGGQKQIQTNQIQTEVNWEGRSGLIVLSDSIPGTSCVGYDTLGVQPNLSKVALPQLFTPNQDNQNDRFYLLVAEQTETIQDLDFRVFNQQGLIVYQTQDIEEASDSQRGWDGGNHPTGMYLYQVRLDFESCKTKVLKGSVKLVR